MKKIVIALALAGLSIGTVAQADIRINARQANQQRQIDAGKRSGKLSRAERDRLTAQQHSIDRTKKQAERSGGRFTDAEVRRVNALLDRSQNDIVRAKHNRVRGRNGVHL
ncbi:hypothetical protein [Sphingomonas sp.]|uniref:hypothetical protein n=1 Tax=Sphingomonas sp. TaxID=28214 RepID=UPI0025F340A9|nr:hypothetical protein [Sphingomonas sp.]